VNIVSSSAVSMRKQQLIRLLPQLNVDVYCYVLRSESVHRLASQPFGFRQSKCLVKWRWRSSTSTTHYYAQMEKLPGCLLLTKAGAQCHVDTNVRNPRKKPSPDEKRSRAGFDAHYLDYRWTVHHEECSQEAGKTTFHPEESAVSKSMIICGRSVDPWTL